MHDETKLGTGGCSRGRTNQCLNAINFDICPLKSNSVGPRAVTATGRSEFET